MCRSIEFNYSKLRGRIKELFGTQQIFADKIGMSNASLSDKLNQKSDFTKSEMISICDSLKVDYEDIPAYFFSTIVKEV